MGEYAIRKSDSERVKIGTCEEMYYLRYEDRDKVRHEHGNVDPMRPDGLRFRLPFPDEDHLRPGEYEDFNRAQRLYRMVKSKTTSPDWHEDFSDPEASEHPGHYQLRHERSGLLLSVPCYHGEKLPEVGPGMTAHWNGKGFSLALSSLRVVGTEVFPVVRCVHCEEAWRYQWAQLWEYIPQPLRDRLKVYAGL